MFGLQFIHFADEFVDLLKSPIDTGKADICDLVQLAQCLHHARANFRARNLAVIFIRDIVHNFLNDLLDGLGADGPLLAGFFQARQQLLPGKLLPPAIPLDHHQAFVLDFLVGGKALGTLQTLAAAADG